jgi:hypothetical protein
MIIKERKPYKIEDEIKNNQFCSCCYEFSKEFDKETQEFICDSCERDKDDSNDNSTPCEVCGKISHHVRFEGSFEGFICDSCLYDFNNNLIERVKQ